MPVGREQEYQLRKGVIYSQLGFIRLYNGPRILFSQDCVVDEWGMIAYGLLNVYVLCIHRDKQC